jgi:SAM-dependent methyltransferase
MLEVSALLAIFILLPPGIPKLLWSLLLFAFALPGVYAMLRGAPFVPTSAETVKRMLKVARIKKGEKVYDPGCGDGRLVIAAAREGAQAVGYELSVPTYVLARIRSFGQLGVRIRFRNLWRQKYSDADVLFCYLLVAPMQRFKREIWPTLKPGCRVVSHAFRMEGIEPTEVLGDAVLYVKK